MICAFCGEKFNGRPVKQAGLAYCSIECANMAAEVGSDEEEYFDEVPLDLESADDDETY
jgi:hypothetical protein